MDILYLHIYKTLFKKMRNRASNVKLNSDNPKFFTPHTTKLYRDNSNVTPIYIRIPKQQDSNLDSTTADDKISTLISTTLF